MTSKQSSPQQTTTTSPQLKIYRVSIAADVTASSDEEAHATAHQLASEIQSADAYIDEIVDENWNEI